MSEQEPWLRGIQLDASPIVAPVLFALQQVREDLASINVSEIWMHGHRIPSLGFQLSHIAGSLDRLTTYLQGNGLTESQFEYLRTERMPGRTRDELMSEVNSALDRAEAVIRSIDPSTYPDLRYVGRQKLPTTVIGLIIHIAEHTQRHCGQALTTSKL